MQQPHTHAYIKHNILCSLKTFINKNIDIRLVESMTKTYLKSETKYNSSKNILYMPALMGWFRRDFGGKKKMIMLVKKLDIIPADTNPKIKFNKYNWDLFLQNYQTNTK